jgi:hypothetical protein
MATTNFNDYPRELEIKTGMARVTADLSNCEFDWSQP